MKYTLTDAERGKLQRMKKESEAAQQAVQNAAKMLQGWQQRAQALNGAYQGAAQMIASQQGLEGTLKISDDCSEISAGE